MLGTLVTFYGCLAFANAVFMLALHFLHDRRGYYKTAAGVWIGILTSFAADGIVVAKFGNVNHVFAIPMIGITMHCLAKLAKDLYKLQFRLRPLMAFAFFTWALGAVMHFVFDAGFTSSAFVICLGIVAPGIAATHKLFQRWNTLNIIDRMFGLAILAEALHIMDYPFLRPIESAAVFGFSFALLLIYFISMLIPVVINRRISADLNEILENKVQERTEQLVLAQEKLTQSAKMAALGEMAGGIAHEINTPLGTISLISEQIQDLVNEDPLDRQALTDLTKTVSRTVQRITDIILGLRTFSRDGTNDRFENASVKQIIEDTLALCREKIKHAEVQIKVNAIDDNMTLFCRPVQISQVLLNLINNSCDALMPLHEKWIDISVESCNDTIEISVMDSGSGITESIQRKLYQPFFSTKPIGQGTGLGLSVSKGIIQSHKGTLSLDTTSRNTRFVFTLPKTDSMLVRNQGKHSA